jgi:hypothetical protein
MEGKGEAWEGTRGGTKGREKRMRGREELGRPETRGKQKMFVRFLPWEVYALLPEGINAPCCLDVIRFVYEEFKVDEVRKV